jgi:hypothetical protein
LTFAAIVAALHVLEPRFDPMDRFVSEYALSDWGLLMNVAFSRWGRHLSHSDSTSASALLRPDGFA